MNIFSQGLFLLGLVGLDGLEPSTSRLSGARSNLLSYRPVFFPYSLSLFEGFPRFRSFSLPYLGGDDGIRTHDPLLAGQVLSQLSYTPIGLSDLFSLSMSYPSLKIEQQPLYPLLLPNLVFVRHSSP